MVSEDILRACVVYHKDAWPTHEYYDRKNRKLSRMYNGVVAEKGDRVAYFTEDYKLIIRNMFDEKVYYKEVKRDFTPLPKEVRRMAILQVDWERPDAIVVQYLAGPERRMVTEEIVFDI